MKYKLNLLIFTLILVIYGLNQLFLKNLGFYFFNNYLNDLLAVPLFFTIINIVYQFNSGKQITSFKSLFILTIILSFMGEYLAIYLRENSVCDLWDVVCYFIGMMIYYGAISKIAK